MEFLKFALLSNSLFSLTIGIILTVQASSISNLFGVQESWFFTALGIALVLFSTILFYIGRQKPIHPISAFVIIILDIMWVAGSAVILLLDPFNLTQTGNILIGIVALIVLVITLLEARGLYLLDKNPKTGFKEFKYKRKVSANKSTAWKIISDVANYHHVAPNIDEVKVISGLGEGMVRQCSQGDGTWTEKCILWNEGVEYSFRVNTDAPSYPFPFSFLQGTWKVQPINERESIIEMLFELQFSKKIYNLLLHPFMAPKFDKIVDELLDNWEGKIATEKLDT